MTSPRPGDGPTIAPVPPVAVFLDFDGTMTSQDMIAAIWRRFAAPGWDRKVEAMLAGRMTLRDVVTEVFATIPSSRADEITRFAMDAVRFRPGLDEFLLFCRGREVPVSVASGALDFFLLPTLERWTSGERPLLTRVYAITADLSGPVIRVLPPHDCPECSLCKAAVLRERAGTHRILVGDGVTDVHGAMEAEQVFARGRLLDLLAQRGKPCQPFEDFFDVMRALE